MQYLDVALESTVSSYPLNYHLMQRLKKQESVFINIVDLNTLLVGLNLCNLIKLLELTHPEAVSHVCNHAINWQVNRKLIVMYS